MMILRRTALAAVALLLAACATGQLPSTTRAPAEPAPVILISIDGFRPDYLDRGNTPTLSRLAREGVRGDMRPSFPSVTFPNHYTLVTGLRPDHHGIIQNRFEDARRPNTNFVYSNPALANDPLWWEEGTPIWVTLERDHIKTGTMFWPGSDYELQGVRPSQWRAFDQTLPGFARVDVLLSWFDLPPAERPRFFTLYFDLVDTAGHRYGPDSPDTNASVAETDAAMARLVEGLRRRHVAANIVIVADHGMAVTPPNAVIDVDPLIANVGRMVFDGQVAGFAPLPGHDADLAQRLVGRKEHGECWRKENIPARFHYGSNARVPMIICLADLGWAYRSASQPWTGPPSRGAHGYDNEAPDMRAIFIANGPSFRRGARLPTFDNVSVYPLLMRLMGVAPLTNDGNPADTAAALR